MAANLFPSLAGMFGKTHFKQILTDKQIGFEPKHKFKQKKCKDWPSQICLQPWTNVCLHLREQYHILSKGHICFWHVLRVVCKCPISVWHIWGASILSLLATLPHVTFTFLHHIENTGNLTTRSVQKQLWNVPVQNQKISPMVSKVKRRAPVTPKSAYHRHSCQKVYPNTSLCLLKTHCTCPSVKVPC